MSKLSFKAFCIEFYSKHTGVPENEVYQLFQKEGILDMLEEDYEDLHGMSIEYLIPFFDNYLRGEIIC